MDKNTPLTDETVTVLTYRPPAYIEATFDVISESKDEGSFAPTQFEKVAEKASVVDPMFADFSKVDLAPAYREDKAQTDSDSFIGSIEIQSEASVEDESSRPDMQASSEQEEVEEVPIETLSNDNQPAECNEIDTLESDSSKDTGVDLANSADDSDTQLVTGVDEIEPGENDIEESSAIVDNEAASHIQPVFTAMDQALHEEYERGKAEGSNQVRLIQAQLEERYTLMWEDMQTQLDESIRAHEQQAVELALQVAKRLVGDVVESQREYVVPLIQAALKAAGGAKIKNLRVSPQDFEFLSLGKYGESIKVMGDSKLVFEQDDSIRAGCILTTSAGEIDFDLDQSWERIRAKILRGSES